MILRRPIPISDQYRRPIFDAVVLQVVFGGLSLLILDGGDSARICGVALLAFWSGVFVLICRHPRHPSKLDLELIRWGYVLVLVLALVVVHLAWKIRGL